MNYQQDSNGTYPIGTLPIAKGEISILTPYSDAKRDGMEVVKRLLVKSGDWECIALSDYSARDKKDISGKQRQAQLMIRHPSYNGELFYEIAGSHLFRSGCVVFDPLFGAPESRSLAKFLEWCRGWDNEMINITPEALIIYLSDNLNTIRVARNKASEIVAIKVHRSENWVRI